jgi:hypothetical protein
MTPGTFPPRRWTDRDRVDDEVCLAVVRIDQPSTMRENTSVTQAR